MVVGGKDYIPSTILKWTCALQMLRLVTGWLPVSGEVLPVRVPPLFLLLLRLLYFFFLRSLNIFKIILSVGTFFFWLLFCP